MGEQKAKKIKQEDVLAEAEAQLKAIAKKEKQATSTSSGQAEKSAKPETDETKEKKSVKTASSAVRRRGGKIKSKKYLAGRSQIEVGNAYDLEEAIELVKKASYAKFDASVDLHLHFVAKKGKGEDPIARGILDLPHGAGRKPKVLVLDEKKVEEIVKTKKIDFDVALATPSQMINLAKSGLARILGPKGKMPNPKYGTVTEDITGVQKMIEAGRVEYRLDEGRNLHQSVGKISWDNKKIEENIKAVLSKLPMARIKSATISSTMSPGIKIQLKTKK